MREVGQVRTIQILRGVAAMLVMFYHLQPMMNATWRTFLHGSFGAFGVDLFFVISGFVMYYSNRRMDRTAGAFIVMRLLRIVPLYWVATLFLVILFAVGFHPVGLHVLDARMVLESAMFVPSGFPGGRRDLILSIGWTLMYELFFYFCFALALRAATPAKSLATVAGVFAVLVAVGRAAGPLPYLADFYTSPIVFEFLYGGALALGYMRFERLNQRWRMPGGMAAVAVGLCVVILLDVRGVPVPGRQGFRFITYGVPALLIVGGALALERRASDRGMRPLLLVGAASYALYLFHPMLLQMMVKGSARVLPPAGAASPFIAATIAGAATILIAILIHRLIETPILAIGRRLIACVGGPPSTLPAAMANAHGSASPAENRR